MAKCIDYSKAWVTRFHGKLTASFTMFSPKIIQLKCVNRLKIPYLEIVVERPRPQLLASGAELRSKKVDKKFQYMTSNLEA
jgi:hypothetical protein